jgi:hypothetical protein
MFRPPVSDRTDAAYFEISKRIVFVIILREGERERRGPGAAESPEECEVGTYCFPAGIAYACRRPAMGDSSERGRGFVEEAGCVGLRKGGRDVRARLVQAGSKRSFCDYLLCDEGVCESVSAHRRAESDSSCTGMTRRRWR